MNPLLDKIATLTAHVVKGTHGLDEALTSLESWLEARAAHLTAAEREQFSAVLDQESTNDDRSLVDSILKLHATRLLHRYDALARHDDDESDGQASDYEVARRAFERALLDSEAGINEARIDVAIANAHNLLGDADANRRWLDKALARLPGLAAADLEGLAKRIPAMPMPRLNPLKKLGLRFIGFSVDRLAEENRRTLATIADMQSTQIVLLAHLIGASLLAIDETSRARRAFRVAAHLIVRLDGLPGQEVGPLLDMAHDLRPYEPEAAELLATQAEALSPEAGGGES